jgi:hypothetical protein
MPHLIKQRQIEGGVGGGVGGAFAKYTPTLIPSGESFIVPENTQVLWAVSITSTARCTSTAPSSK